MAELANVHISTSNRHPKLSCVLSTLALVGLFALGVKGEPSELPPEIGYNYGEIETPRVAAAGGAQRALGSSVSGLFLNPANMATSRVYHVGALAQIWPEASRQSYGAGAVDSMVSSWRLAGGFGGTWTVQDPEGVNRESADLRFALAFPFSDTFFVGLGGRYLWLSQDGLGPLGHSLASGGLRGENIVESFGFDAGATLKPTRELAIAILGSNLNNPGHGFMPLNLGGGVGYGTETFSLEADVLADFTTWDDTALRAMAGFELLAAGRYPLRIGYRYDAGTESHAVSGGLGYIDQSLAVEASVRRVVSGEAATAVILGITYHVESSGMTPSPADSF